MSITLNGTTGITTPAIDNQGDLTVDTNTLFVDSANNRVGIGTSSPSANLHVDSSSSTYSANIKARNSNFGNGVVGAANGILTVATDMNNIAFYTASNLGVYGTSAPTNERMRIDSTGRVTMPYQPAFHAYSLGGSFGASGGVFIPTVILTNVGGYYSASSGRFTAPVAGTYQFTVCSGRFDPNAADLQQKWYKNGGVISQHFNPANNSSTGIYFFFTNCIILSLNANDYVDYRHIGGSGSTSPASGSFFAGHLIG